MTDSANSNAYEQLTSLIRHGHFTGGQALRAARLAELIGQSRTPIREALSRLAAEGIVELLPNRGARLVALSADDVREIFVMRSLIEPWAAGLAAQRASTEELQSMDSTLEALEALGDDVDVEGDSWTKLNLIFHEAVIDAARSDILGSVYRLVRKEPLVHQTSFTSWVDPRRACYQHRDILDALKSRNTRWAEAAMFSHIEGTRELYHHD
jgi:DNA-binding GntR family transcriptional regulator